MASLLIELKEYQKAISMLQGILRLAPESDKIRFYLAGVHEEIKEYPAAIENYLRISSISSYYPEAVIHASYLYKTLGNYKFALKTVQNGINERDDISQFYAFYASLLDDAKEVSNRRKRRLAIVF